MDSIPSIVFLVIAPLLPSFLWMVFFLRADIHPEPKRLLIAAFNVGALVSAPVLALQVLFQMLVGESATGFQGLTLIVGLALIEEVFKFGGTFWIVRKHPAFDEPVDAMIYIIAAALGFATVENFFITLNMLQSANPFPLSDVTQTLLLRFTGATLLHVLSSAIVGYYWAKERFIHFPKDMVIWGLVIATLVHSLFNYLVLQFENSFLIYPSLFLIVTAFFVVTDFERLKNSKT